MYACEKCTDQCRTGHSNILGCSLLTVKGLLLKNNEVVGVFCVNSNECVEKTEFVLLDVGYGNVSGVVKNEYWVGSVPMRMLCSLQTSLEPRPELMAVSFDNRYDDDEDFSKRLTYPGYQNLRATCGNAGLYFSSKLLLVNCLLNKLTL